MSFPQQSPINIHLPVPAQDVLRLDLNWRETHGTIGNCGGHGVKIEFHDAKNVTVLDGSEYFLREMHFHHPGEHLINGVPFAAELHMVHQSASDDTRLVLGLFLDVCHMDESVAGEEDMADFIQCLESTRRNIPTNPNDWLRPEPHITYRYEGSLTTEPYTENVTWIVFKKPKTIGKHLYRAIFQDTCPHAREVQPLYRRFVLMQHWSSCES